MKLPVTLPSYLCGECGIEMLLDRRPPKARVSGPLGPMVGATCHTSSCSQRGVEYEILLQAAPVPSLPDEDGVEA